MSQSTAGRRRVHQRSTLGAAIEPLERRALLSGVLLNPDSTGVSGKLLQLAASGSAPIGDGTPVTDPTSFVFDSSGRVSVRITATDVDALAAPLADRGFQTIASLPASHLIEGYLPISAIPDIGQLSSQGLLGVMPVYKPITSVGNVTSQGDAILEAQRTRAATGDTGAGVTVGVLSDSYNNLGTAANGVASGDLPNNVNVLQDLPSGGTDEGRAMLEVVHDLAPGSNLAFATADVSEAGFAQNIVNLAKPVAQGGAGANVIVDDISYFDEPFFQDGIVAQAVDTAVTTYGSAYFAAAGNIDTQSYESTNVNFVSDTLTGISASPSSYYNFTPGGVAHDRQTFSLTSEQEVVLSLEWNQPYYTVSGVTSNLTIYILNHTTGAVVASSTDDAIANQTPNQIIGFQNASASTNTFDVVIQLAAGSAPSRLKYENFGANEFGDVAFNFATNSDTVNPHSASANAMSVAAAPFFDERNKEAFTSEGPATILFSANGTPLGSAQVRAKPDITATDGVDTSFFGGSAADADGNGFPNFFGTSCAAPHAAAVAALIKAAHPTFTPAQIYSAMKTTADPNISGTPGNPNFTGSGLIDAYRAVVGTPAPATLNVSDGLETGSLAQDWEVYTSGTGRAQVLNTFTPQTGSFHLVMDGNLSAPANQAFGFPNLEEAILHLNLLGASNVTLSFGKKSIFNGFGIESTQTMPATFSGHGNFDGVAMSVDGVNWKLVQGLTAATNSTYQTFNLNLSTIAANAGITLSADTQIKFQHFDPNTNSAPNAGFAFDNFQVNGTVTAGSISGQTFQDNNGNGASDGGEPTLNGVTVFLDTNNNGLADDGPGTSVVTSGSGNFNFSGLANGTYHLRETTPTGYLQTSSLADLVVSGAAVVSNIGNFPITFPVAPGTGAGNDTYNVSLDGTGLNEQINDGSTTYTILKASLASSVLTFNGNAGDDTLTLDFTNGSPIPVAGITYAGGTQINGDTLAIVGSSGAESAVFNASTVVVGNTISDSGIENFTFNGNGGNDNVTVNSGTVVFPATQVLSTLTLADNTHAQLASGGNKVLVVSTLSIGSGAALDLTDEDAIFKVGGSLPAVQTFVGNGFLGGAWTGGGGINSSTAAAVAADASNIHKTALGYALASNTTLGSSFDGQSISGTDVVIRYTDVGDANLDGNVSTPDFMRLANNFGGAGSTWSQAEFTFDGVVNALDFNSVATNFGQALAAPLPAALFSESPVTTPSVDEPPAGRYKFSLWDGDPFVSSDRNLDTLPDVTA